MNTEYSHQYDCTRWMFVDVYRVLSAFEDGDWISSNEIYSKIPSTKPPNLINFLLDLCLTMYPNEFKGEFRKWIHYVHLSDSYDEHRLNSSRYNYDTISTDSLFDDIDIFAVILRATCCHVDDLIFPMLYRARLISDYYLTLNYVASANDLRTLMIVEMKITRLHFVRAMCDIATELNSNLLHNLMFYSIYSHLFLPYMTDEYKRLVR